MVSHCCATESTVQMATGQDDDVEVPHARA